MAHYQRARQTVLSRAWSMSYEGVSALYETRLRGRRSRAGRVRLPFGERCVGVAGSGASDLAACAKPAHRTLRLVDVAISSPEALANLFRWAHRTLRLVDVAMERSLRLHARANLFSASLIVAGQRKALILSRIFGSAETGRRERLNPCNSLISLNPVQGTNWPWPTCTGRRVGYRANQATLGRACRVPAGPRGLHRLLDSRQHHQQRWRS